MTKKQPNAQEWSKLNNESETIVENNIELAALKCLDKNVILQSFIKCFNADTVQLHFEKTLNKCKNNCHIIKQYVIV